MKIHPSSDIHSSVVIGEGSQIWLWCQIREQSKIGKDCILGKGVYIDSHVDIGDRVKIGNHVSVFRGVTLEDNVFVGPHVCFTNDLRPRAANLDNTIKGTVDWVLTPTRVEHGASIGANSTILCGTNLGRWCMVAAGSVVTKDVPAYALVLGNPARVVGYVCPCGNKASSQDDGVYQCDTCKKTSGALAGLSEEKKSLKESVI